MGINIKIKGMYKNTCNKHHINKEISKAFLKVKFLQLKFVLNHKCLILCYYIPHYNEKLSQLKNTGKKVIRSTKVNCLSEL